ncbi:hypothetical protein MHYP_G00066400 [Metynnis hypsauchen]
MLLQVEIKMKAPLNVLLTLALYGLTSCLVREHIHVDKIMTWLEAQEYCRLHYDDLSTLSTQQEVKQLVDIEHLSCPTSTGYHWWCVYGRWTGLYTNTLTLPVPIWKWSGGENETLCTWANGEPNKMPDEACGLIFIKMGQCYNVPCSWNLSFFCMDMYEVILVQKNKTWQKALDYCRKHYIDLVSLKADNWMKNAVEVTKAAQTAYVWTGLYFLSGEWFWAKGDALEYQAWSTEGQPQCPATNHRCVALGQKEEIWQPRAWAISNFRYCL